MPKLTLKPSGRVATFKKKEPPKMKLKPSPSTSNPRRTA